MRKQDLFRLTALAVVLTAVFVIIALRLRPEPPQVIVPTMMSLPSETATEAAAVADLPTATDSPAAPSDTATDAPPTPTNTATDIATDTATHTITSTNTATRTHTSTATDTASAVPTLPPVATPLPIPTVAAQLGAPPAQPVENQVVITFAPETSEQEQAAYIASIGGEVTRSIESLNAIVVEVPEAVDELPPSDVVADVEPDHYVTALIDVPPSDSYYNQQWALPAMNVPAGWLSLPENAPAVVVAVIDSGVCADHPDLQGVVLPGWDYVENDSTPQDVFGHGCGVAGIIAANSNNGIGIAGIAPNARILPLRVLDAGGSGTYSNVAAAIVSATDLGAQIINLSLGGSVPSTTLENAINYAVSRGVIMVAAAGNTGQPGVLYPAAYPSVIAVASVNSNLQPSSFNSTGPEIDTYAPGQSVLSLLRSGAYGTMSGTSFAAPQVAGVAALEIGRGRSLAINGGVISVSSAPLPTETPAAPSPTPDSLLNENMLTDVERALLQQVRNRGIVEVIVGMNMPFRFADEAGSQELRMQDVSVQQMRAALLQRLAAYNAEVLSDSTNWTIPYVALRVDERALIELLVSPEITTIEENRLIPFSLDTSTAVIRAPQAWALSYTGNEQTIAILDTGVDGTHPFFGNRVIAEACYSAGGQNSTTLCPNGQTTQAGTGAASPDRCIALGLQGCEHGTHVAGIAAGSTSGLSGVAPGANIVAVQVFSQVQLSQPQAWYADILSGLNYVYSLRTTYSIAAVNLSLGSEAYSNHCDSAFPAMTTSFAQLRTTGIAPVVATGNNGYTSQISFPACISHAVSVGASTDGDARASFSNTAAGIQELFAPGVSIFSSVPPNSQMDLWDGNADGFGWMQGTSMAAPHVTGAFAIYRELAPSVSVDAIVNTFRSTGLPVSVTGGTIPRLNIEEAIQSIMPTAENVGYADFQFGAVCNSTPSGEKPQSKLWWADGSWWGVLCSNADSRYHIYRLDLNSQTWVDTGVVTDDRTATKVEVLWDATAQKLYVLSHIFSGTGSSDTRPARLYRYSYNSSTDTYSLDSGFPADAAYGRWEDVVLAKDSTGQLWITMVQDSQVMVNNSQGSDNVWGTPFVIPSSIPGSVNVNSDDISSIVAFQGKIGVIWSNQNTEAVYFAVHQDSAADNVWSVEVVESSNKIADDHFSIQVDASGRLFVASKTSLSGSNPLVVMFTRQTNGQWSRTTFGNSADGHTRPVLLLDESNNRVYLFATAPESGGAIYYKTSPMDNPSFPAGRGQVFISNSGATRINNASTTDQRVNTTTGILVIATDQNTRRYYHNYMSIGGVTPTDTPTPTPTFTATATNPSIPPNPSGIGIYYNGTWYLRDSASSGSPNWMPTYGGFGTPVVGDWNGNGTDTLGIYYNGSWYLRNRNDKGAVDYPVFTYGGFGTPVVGDWNGDGIDTVGVYANGTWYLRNSNSSGAPSIVFQYGGFGIPVVGDWDGDGTDTVGIYNPADGRWYLRNGNSSGAPSYPPFVYGGFGVPMVGDWNGDGRDTVGIYYPVDGRWYLRNSNSSGAPSYAPFVYGGFGTPVVGTWSIAGVFGLDGAMTAFSGDWNAIMDELIGDPITPTLSPTPTMTAAASATFSATPTPSLTATFSSTPTPSATATTTALPSQTYTAMPTTDVTETEALPTIIPSPTPTPLPTEMPSPTEVIPPTIELSPSPPQPTQPGAIEETEAF